MGKPNRELDGIQYRDGKMYCWRRNELILTEHMVSHINRSRDSGQYGTGAYCFENLHPAIGLKLGDEVVPEAIPRIETIPLLKLNITNLNLYEPHNIRDLEHFSKSLRKIVWHYLDTPKEAHTIEWLEEYHDLRNDIENEADLLIRNDPQLEPIRFNIRSGITRTIECVEDKGLAACSQPINHVLDRAGFDGVKPFTDQANLGRWGILILKEDLGKIDCVLRSGIRDLQNGDKVDNYCDIFPSKDTLKPFLEDERNDDYLQVTSQTQLTHRMDYHKWLRLTDNMTVEKKRIEINRIFNSCLKWAVTYPDMPKEKKEAEKKNTERQCKLIRDYYLRQVEQTE